jgi:hypothetical protein
MIQAPDGTDPLAGILTAHHDVGTGTFADSFGSQPLSGPPAGGVQDSGRRQAGVVQFLHLISYPAVLDHAAGIRSRKDRHAGFKRFQHPFAASFPKTSHVVCVRGKLRGSLGGDIRKSRDVDQRRNNRDGLLNETGYVPGQEASGVFNAVNPGVEHVIDGVFSEAVGRHPGSFIAGGRDGIPDNVRGKGSCEVAGVTVDPVSDDLHPPVSITGFLADSFHEPARLDFMAQAAQIPAAACNVAACPDEPGQVLALLHPPCVAGRPGIADQQRAGV